MNKQGFLNELRRSLSNLPKDEVDEILRDQEEYIREAIAAGRSEEDVIRGLGSPNALAASLSAESKIHQAQQATSLGSKANHTLGAIGAIIVLAPLNLIFVLGPFLGISGAIVGGWGAAVGVLFAAIAVLVTFFTHLIFINVGLWAHFSAFFFLVGCVGASVLAMILMAVITKVFLTLTISYLEWNLKFIRARA